MEFLGLIEEAVFNDNDMIAYCQYTMVFEDGANE